MIMSYTLWTKITDSGKTDFVYRLKVHCFAAQIRKTAIDLVYGDGECYLLFW